MQSLLDLVNKSVPIRRTKSKKGSYHENYKEYDSDMLYVLGRSTLNRGELEDASKFLILALDKSRSSKKLLIKTHEILGELGLVMRRRGGKINYQKALNLYNEAADDSKKYGQLEYAT